MYSALQHCFLNKENNIFRKKAYTNSVVDPDLDPYWIRIQELLKKMQIQDKMEANIKTLINNSETQLIKNFFM